MGNGFQGLLYLAIAAALPYELKNPCSPLCVSKPFLCFQRYLQPCFQYSISKYERQKEKLFLVRICNLIPSNICQSFMFFAVSQVVARVLPFMVNALVTRRLTPEEMGVRGLRFSNCLHTSNDSCTTQCTTFGSCCWDVLHPHFHVDSVSRMHLNNLTSVHSVSTSCHIVSLQLSLRQHVQCKRYSC